MIVVKIELWPGGSEKRAKEIGRTYINNVGGNYERGNYHVSVCRRGSTRVPQETYASAGHPEFAPDAPKATRTGSVTDYPREQFEMTCT